VSAASLPAAQITLAGSGGGVYHYLFGVMAVVERHCDLSDVLYAGTSGGALVGMFSAAGFSMQEAFENVNLRFLKDVRKHWTGSFLRWNKIARRHMLASLPADTYAAVSDRLHVSLTTFPRFKNRIVSAWTDNADLVDCVIGSCFFPMNDTRLWYSFRGERYWDGSFSNNVPVVLPPDRVPSVTISVDRWRPFRNLVKWWCWTDEGFARDVYALGTQDALDHLDELTASLPPRHVDGAGAEAHDGGRPAWDRASQPGSVNSA
jgi:predicted acylesterase/phospholipase RssA